MDTAPRVRMTVQSVFREPIFAKPLTLASAGTLGYLCRKGKSEMVRLSAARAVLELGTKLRENVELEVRIAALESRQRGTKHRIA